MSERPDFEEAVRTIIVCFKSQVKGMGEFIPVSKDDNEVTTHFWKQARLDRKTGWEWYYLAENHCSFDAFL